MKIHKTSSETALSNQKENQMNQIRLHVWGDYACFIRPEMKWMFYDVMTPVVFGISGSSAYASISALLAAV